MFKILILALVLLTVGKLVGVVDLSWWTVIGYSLLSMVLVWLFTIAIVAVPVVIAAIGAGIIFLIAYLFQRRK